MLRDQRVQSLLVRATLPRPRPLRDFHVHVRARRAGADLVADVPPGARLLDPRLCRGARDRHVGLRDDLLVFRGHELHGVVRRDPLVVLRPGPVDPGQEGAPPLVLLLHELRLQAVLGHHFLQGRARPRLDRARAIRGVAAALGVVAGLLLALLLLLLQHGPDLALLLVEAVLVVGLLLLLLAHLELGRSKAVVLLGYAVARLIATIID
mmetsp:Transcript_8563/g.25475  ORF Transcript_8563/g.25475 Transcript_8563/m.25475 type:complete len:209 (-) Transcript_8563:374-1000(-)